MLILLTLFILPQGAVCQLEHSQGALQCTLPLLHHDGAE